MQVSPPLPPSVPSFDDFLNLDIDASNQQQQDDLHDLFSPRLSDSAASPASASTSFLPPNTPPPQQQQVQPQSSLDTLNPNHIVFNELYHTYIAPLKASSQFAGSSTVASTSGDGAFSFADLFANYGNDSLFQPITATTVPTAATTPQGLFPFTIDPALVATPATTAASPLISQPTASSSSSAPIKAASVPRASTASIAEDDDEDDDEDDEDDDDGMLSVPGKGGKGSRKSSGGVATGGIVKRTGATSCVVRDADSNDPEDWRPTPEEYKKLSSKEKRQLRNKISARNFRVRRKEYITTLEGQISDRDKLISAIRDELGAQKLENAELRQEIDNLKKVMLGAPHPTGLPPPDTTAAKASTPATRRPLAKVNPNKDVAAGKSFWGGAVGAGMGGITPVHATIIPDLAPSMASVLGGKAAGGLTGGRWIPMSTASLGTLPGHAAPRQENINPNMNDVFRSPLLSSSSSSPSSPSSGSESTGPVTPPPQSPPSLSLVGFNQQQMQQWNGLGDINPFTIKTLDSYRMQLWAKMAAAGQLPGFTGSPQQQQPQPLQPVYNTTGQPSSSFANQLRPAFFTSSSDKPASSAPKTGSTTPPSLSALMAGKAASSLSTPAASTSTPPAPTSTPQQVQFAAALASQSLVSRMGSAFWDAFSGGASSSTSASAKSWDMDKVRKVLEGKAVLKVVDVETPLEEKMRSLTLNTGMTVGEREVELPAPFKSGGVLKQLLK